MDQSTRQLRTPGELLEAALAKEKEAYEFYSNLLNHSKVGFLREIVQQLKDEEHRHVKLIEAKLAALQSGRL